MAKKFHPKKLHRIYFARPNLGRGLNKHRTKGGGRRPH